MSSYIMKQESGNIISLSSDESRDYKEFIARPGFDRAFPHPVTGPDAIIFESLLFANKMLGLVFDKYAHDKWAAYGFNSCRQSTVMHAFILNTVFKNKCNYDFVPYASDFSGKLYGRPFRAVHCFIYGENKFGPGGMFIDIQGKNWSNIYVPISEFEYPNIASFWGNRLSDHTIHAIEEIDISNLPDEEYMIGRNFEWLIDKLVHLMVMILESNPSLEDLKSQYQNILSNGAPDLPYGVPA